MLGPKQHSFIYVRCLILVPFRKNDSFTQIGSFLSQLGKT